MEDATIEHWLRRRRQAAVPRDFTHSKSRVRMDWQARKDSLTDREFKRTYRISKETFDKVLAAIRDQLQPKSPEKARQDLHGAVQPELLLSMTLRFLAGGSYLDIYQMHGVGASTMYHAIPVVCHAIIKAFPLHFPIGDEAALVSMLAQCLA